MSVYDTTFVLNPQLEEAGLDERIKEVIDLIGSNGGKIVKENRIGMRKLAYEIKKLTQGYYVSLVFEGDGALINEMERRFRLDENCLRFLTCLYQEITKTMEVSPMHDREGRGYDRDRKFRGRGDRDRDDRRSGPPAAKAEDKPAVAAKPAVAEKPAAEAPAKTEKTADAPVEKKTDDAQSE